MEKICKYCKEIYITNRKRSEVCDVCKEKNKSKATKKYWKDPVYCEKISKARKKTWQNLDYLKKMEMINIRKSELMIRNNPMKNPIIAKKVSIKTKENWDNGKIDLRGEKSGLWRGGTSQTYYSRIAKENLILECSICETHEGQLLIHHKDKNRKNNNLKNLMIVCKSCHNKIHKIIPLIRT